MPNQPPVAIAQIACVTWSPPGTALSQGDCHMRTRSASVAEIFEPVADIEAEHEQQESGDRHPDAAARDGVDREKDAAQKQRRTEILLKEKEQERQADASEHRQHVFGARQVDPFRHRTSRMTCAAQRSQQLPAAGEVAGEKQRQQQPNRFDRLHRPQIDLRGAVPRTGAERDQQHRQRQRARQRKIAELGEPDPAEVDERDGRHHEKARERAFGEAHEQQAVAQRIGRLRSTAKPMAVSRCATASSRRSPRTPRSHHTSGTRWKASTIQARVQQHFAPELLTRSHAEERFERREIRRGQERYRSRRHTAGRRGRFPASLQPLRKRVQLLRPVDRRCRDVRARNRADVRQRASLVPLLDQEPRTAPPPPTAGRSRSQKPSPAPARAVRNRRRCSG